MSREEMEEALISTRASTVADALIRMALWEKDPHWAEQKSLSALTDPRKEVRKAALLSIGHLARLHGSLNLDVVLPAVKALLADPEYRGAAEDVLEDIAIFMSKIGDARRTPK